MRPATQIKLPGILFHVETRLVIVQDKCMCIHLLLLNRRRVVRIVKWHIACLIHGMHIR